MSDCSEEVLEKPRKPRTAAQQAVFKKAAEKRAANVAKLRQDKEQAKIDARINELQKKKEAIVPTPMDEPVKKAKPIKEAPESESEEEPEIIVMKKKKPKKKIVVVESDTESDEEIVKKKVRKPKAAPIPVEQPVMQFRRNISFY